VARSRLQDSFVGSALISELPNSVISTPISLSQSNQPDSSLSQSNQEPQTTDMKLQIVSARFRAILLFAILFFVCVVKGQDGTDGCDVEVTTSMSGNYATPDDAIRAEGLDRIDKIEKIQIYAGSYFFNTVVTKIVVTYRMKVGEPKTIERGNGGSLVGTVFIGEGVYLTRINMLVGKYVDYVELCLSDEECFGPWGGKTDLSFNQFLLEDRSVIKGESLLGLLAYVCTVSTTNA
jgi:hypothetical protein